MIFVFGSNKSGIHGAGAARYAAEKLGAVFGVGEGPTGVCYALPTKGYDIEVIPLTEIGKAVQRFLDYAEDNPELTFKVTQVGCGLGGYKAEDIAPMFLGATENCHFDSGWQPWLGDDVTYWGTF